MKVESSESISFVLESSGNNEDNGSESISMDVAIDTELSDSENSTLEGSKSKNVSEDKLEYFDNSVIVEDSIKVEASLNILTVSDVGCSKRSVAEDSRKSSDVSKGY